MDMESLFLASRRVRLDSSKPHATERTNTPKLMQFESFTSQVEHEIKNKLL